MKRNVFMRAAGLFCVGAGLVVVAGCATPAEQSFNENFNQNMPSAPKYSVEDVRDDCYKIRIHQGAPLDDPSRVTYLKNATTIVAQDESHRRGWANWEVNYIQERDQGWMHVLVAEVKEKPAVQISPAVAPVGNP